MILTELIDLAIAHSAKTENGLANEFFPHPVT